MKKYQFLYYMICCGLGFSVIQFFRITENTMFILKFVDLKHDFFADQKKKRLYFILVFIYTSIKVKSKRWRKKNIRQANDFFFWSAPL